MKTILSEPIAITDPARLREIAGDSRFHSGETFKAAANGHKFSPGETRTLTGLVDFPEFNGQQVKITAIREDGSHGKAYYIQGDINKFMNWVYQYRLI